MDFPMKFTQIFDPSNLSRGEALVSFIPGFINSEQRTMGYSHHLLLVLNQLITNYWL